MHITRSGRALPVLLGLALPALFVSCSSSSTSTPPVSNPAPTVTISGTSATTATGPTTLTFTFSQPMSSFPVADVVVSGGTAAASTTLVDTTHYTLVVTPPANTTGIETITVPAGAFTDTAGVANAVAASATQAYNTVPAPVAPTVAITGTTTTAATGPQQLTFTFSQPMTAFPASAVTVTGGTAAASTTRVDSTHYTLVVTPPANSTGTETIAVAVGAFTDTAGLANTVAASATQTYDTVVAQPAPTVAITGTSATTATGPVTLTFTFSQPMSAFPASDVVVTGGTAAASTTLVDTTHYTLVVTPAANTTGILNISVAAGAFTDAAGVANTVAASATQAYDTTVAVAPHYTVLDFNTTLASGFAYTITGFNGLDAAGAATFTSSVPAGNPAGSGPNFVMAVNPPGTTITSGMTLSVGGSLSIGSVPFYATGATTPTATKMTMVVYAPAIGIPIELKVENAGNNGQSVETHANTTAVGWQTLTFDFTQNTMPNGLPTSALNSGFTYNKISVFPNFLATPAAAQTFYFGPITFLGASAPLASPLATSTSGGAPTTGAAAPTLPAASVYSMYTSTGTYTNVPVGDWNPNWSQGGSIADATVGAVKVKLMNLVNYQGIDLSSPDGGPGEPGVLNITGKIHLHISYWTSDGVNLTMTPIDALDHETAIDAGTIVQGAWTDVDFAITAANFDLTTVRQLKFVTSSAGHFYLDNIYFH